MWGVGTLLVDIQEKKLEAKLSPVPLTPIAQNEVDPEIWGHNFPRQLDSFKKTADDTVGTPFGGSVPYSKLERNPALVRLWAGYAFSKDHNEDRGHHYALTDQLKTQRVTLVSQPGACANCHAAEAPQLIESMGWEAFNRTPYNELKEKLHTGTSCHDCHDPKTMVLRITRPAFLQAMERRGVDLSKATRQEMRTYVCAQCHVEYYFAGENKLLTLPWDNGTTVDAIADYYDTLKFKDWTHKETGTPMIKIQHPEFELWGTGLHARSGVSCADCHMPYVREGAIKVSDHWVRSPLTNINQACQTCHRMDDQALRDRIISIQTRTSELLKRAEEAQIDAIDAIAAAQKEGASDADLATARGLHRRASLYWDFVSSENSTGFHSPQETARILAVAVDTARQAQLAVLKIPRKQG
ncbi:MAG: cytochrome c-552 [Nitrospinae bacterium CG11_big_fil_rev_8_21_14_0_20_56_8]|nr:MAG: cytochrome c-552 [Nitrospinae bacterium CG11_big_fil_rev_8_21_14_0_20_56_8]